MTLTGDINQDGKIDKDDLRILRNLLENHGMINVLPPEIRSMLDINHDGSFDRMDIIRLSEVVLAEAQKGDGNTEVADAVTSLRNRLKG